jgi:hypothetical protein
VNPVTALIFVVSLAGWWLIEHLVNNWRERDHDETEGS